MSEGKPGISSKRLYCIAYEYRVKVGEWAPALVYLHAEDEGDARVQYLNSETPEGRRHMRVVGIAPVVGFHTDDNGEARHV